MKAPRRQLIIPASCFDIHLILNISSVGSEDESKNIFETGK
jgi:hypothetical protein